MQLTADHRSFLATVIGFNERFNVVRAGEQSHALHLLFWSEAEILRASDIQENWGIPKPLVPFYGDWHTVICLDPKHGSVQLLNDQRHTVSKWSTPCEFLQCLAWIPEDTTDTSGIIAVESWLNF